MCRNSYGQDGDLFGSIRGGVSGMDKSYPSVAKGTVHAVPSFVICEHSALRMASDHWSVETTSHSPQWAEGVRSRVRLRRGVHSRSVGRRAAKASCKR